ncbi:hypothetical protein [Paraburkholderia sp. J12]|uniref:hypothetical protein n=1 Tax=Paraburkholderia sp. J12 TaxID=2805432 RepID=UPI002ABD2E8C|nr:hypothetical protein [Paraburkholderia sp. J12]
MQAIAAEELCRAIFVLAAAGATRIFRGDTVPEPEANMESECDQIPGPNPDRFTCTIEGKELVVVLRDYTLYRDDVDLSDLHTGGRIHAAAIDEPSEAGVILRAIVGAAASGDVLALFCANAECRAASLDVLGIDDVPAAQRSA